MSSLERLLDEIFFTEVVIETRDKSYGSLFENFDNEAKILASTQGI